MYKIKQLKKIVDRFFFVVQWSYTYSRTFLGNLFCNHHGVKLLNSMNGSSFHLNFGNMSHKIVRKNFPAINVWIFQLLS